MAQFDFWAISMKAINRLVATVTMSAIVEAFDINSDGFWVFNDHTFNLDLRDS